MKVQFAPRLRHAISDPGRPDGPEKALSPWPVQDIAHAYLIDLSQSHTPHMSPE